MDLPISVVFFYEHILYNILLGAQCLKTLTLTWAQARKEQGTKVAAVNT